MSSEEALRKIENCMNAVLTPALRTLKNDLEKKIDDVGSCIGYEQKDINITISNLENKIAHLEEKLEHINLSFGGSAAASAPDTPVVVTSKVRKSTKPAAKKSDDDGSAKVKTLTEYCSFMWQKPEFRERFATEENMAIIKAAMKTVPKEEASRLKAEGRTFSTKVLSIKTNKALQEQLKKEFEEFKKPFEELKLDGRDSQIGDEEEKSN